MPGNGDSTLVKLSRTGPVYVRLDGLHMIGQAANNGIVPGKLHELVKENMRSQVAGVRGFEEVHIYSHPDNRPNYAVFVFDNEAGKPCAQSSNAWAHDASKKVLPGWMCGARKIPSFHLKAYLWYALQACSVM